MAIYPSRGEIWTATLDPIVGHEQGRKRPVLIVSTDKFNHGPADLVIVAPLTGTIRRLASEVPINPPEGGLTKPSAILCAHVRSISKDRLSGTSWGMVSAQTLARVVDIIATLLEI